ncbi:cytochrome c oxidase, subunit VIa [Peziza echinospora]|nr:cytochrome c oxidase, subunit VIa [Peziza echinospora]
MSSALALFRAARVSGGAAVRRNMMSTKTAGARPLKTANVEAGEAFYKQHEDIRHHAAGASELWRKLSIYIIPPVLTVSTINAYILWNEHAEHVKHEPALEDKVEYSYQNIRTKNYPWGNGDQTIFWNPKVNYHKTD